MKTESNVLAEAIKLESERLAREYDEYCAEVELKKARAYLVREMGKEKLFSSQEKAINYLMLNHGFSSIKGERAGSYGKEGLAQLLRDEGKIFMQCDLFGMVEVSQVFFVE